MFKPNILLMVSSAGIDPWLEIERKAQEKLILDNTKNVTDRIWISGNPRLKPNPTQKLLIFLGKIWMWHYPDRSELFRFVKGGFRRLLLKVPTRALVSLAFPKGGEKSIGRREGNRVEQDLPISMFIAGYRTIATFEWALSNSNFQYLVRITSTCLVNEEPLLDFIRGLPKQRVYAGKVMNNEFMSGAALVLSRDVVEQVVAHQGKMQYKFYEDVALGKLIRDFEIADFIPMNRVDFSSSQQVMLANKEDLLRAPIIRCKAERLTQSAQKVVEVFSAVASRLGWS